MGNPPWQLDNALVLGYAVIGGSIVPTGRTIHRVGSLVIGSTKGLAICKYEGDPGFYLFYCDDSWRVATDTYHDSLVAALRQAEFEYRGVSSVWQTPEE